MKHIVDYTIPVITLLLTSSCSDDSIFGNRDGNDNTISFETTIFNEVKRDSRSNGKKSRYCEFNAKKLENEDLYLLTAVEDHIDVRTDTAAATSRGVKATGASIGTAPYNNMRVYAYSYDNAGYSTFEAAYAASTYNAKKYAMYIDFGELTLKSDGESISASSTTSYPWLSSDKNLKFYGIFPGTTNDYFKIAPNYLPDLYSRPMIFYTVPENINNQIDIMTAVSDEYVGDGKAHNYTADLEMEHVLTAVTVELASGFDGRAITNITISGPKTYGSYLLQDTGATWTTYTTAETRSANFAAADNVTSTADNPFFMIPQTLPSGSTLSVTVTNTQSGVSKTISASIAGGEWQKGTTVHYKLSVDDSETNYIIEPEQSTVYFSYDGTPAGDGDVYTDENKVSRTLGTSRLKSYKEIIYDGNETVYKAVGWTLSATENKSEILTMPSSSSDNAVITDTSVDATGWVYSYRATLVENKGEELKSDDYYNLQKNANNPLGTASSPQDLTYVYPDGTSYGTRYSSNCYIINRPGYYKIPVVTGPSIYKNEKNDATYYVSSSSSYKLYPHVNYGNKPITSPWINESVGKDSNTAKYYPAANGGSTTDTYVEWQDVEGLVNVYNFTQKNGGEFYIRFYINSGTSFKPGNALLAVKDPDGHILWSYHIWVTPYNPRTDVITVQTNPNAGTSSSYLTAKYLKVPLGYVQEDGKKYKFRYSKITFKQDESGDTTSVYLVQRYHEFRPQSCCYYQWGRKDPFPGAQLTENSHLTIYDTYNVEATNKTLYSTDPVSGLSGNGGIKKVSAEKYEYPSEGIYNPTTFYTGHRYPNTYNYINLWGCTQNTEQWTAVDATNNVSLAQGVSSQKTVYDPCPIGFKVPPIYLMPAITCDGTNYTSIYSPFLSKMTTEAEIYSEKANTPYTSHADVQNNMAFEFYTNRMNGTTKSGDTFKLYLFGQIMSTTGEYHNVNTCGYYWSCTRWATTNNENHTKLYSMSFAYGNGTTEFYNMWGNTDTYGMPILAMVGN
jgi:hypothetical protein